MTMSDHRTRRAYTHSVSKNDTPHTTPLRSKGVSVGYLLVILSHTRNIFKWGDGCGA